MLHATSRNSGLCRAYCGQQRRHCRRHEWRSALERNKIDKVSGDGFRSAVTRTSRPASGSGCMPVGNEAILTHHSRVLETPAEANCGFGVSVTRWKLSVETAVVMTHGDCEPCASQQQSTKDVSQQPLRASTWSSARCLSHDTSWSQHRLDQKQKQAAVRFIHRHARQQCKGAGQGAQGVRSARQDSKQHITHHSRLTTVSKLV